MKIVITEEKRDMIIRTEFKKLFDNLTPTRNRHTENIIYVYFNDVYDDEVKGLVYRPSNRELIIYPDYFMSLRMFVSSDEELFEKIVTNYEELTDKPVRHFDISNKN
jgi:hypothetical protein